MTKIEAIANLFCHKRRRTSCQYVIVTALEVSASFSSIASRVQSFVKAPVCSWLLIWLMHPALRYWSCNLMRGSINT